MANKLSVISNTLIKKKKFPQNMKRYPNGVLLYSVKKHITDDYFLVLENGETLHLGEVTNDTDNFKAFLNRDKGRNGKVYFLKNSGEHKIIAEGVRESFIIPNPRYLLYNDMELTDMGYWHVIDFENETVIKTGAHRETWSGLDTKESAKYEKNYMSTGQDLLFFYGRDFPGLNFIVKIPSGETISGPENTKRYINDIKSNKNYTDLTNALDAINGKFYNGH